MTTEEDVNSDSSTENPNGVNTDSQPDSSQKNDEESGTTSDPIEALIEELSAETVPKEDPKETEDEPKKSEDKSESEDDDDEDEDEDDTADTNDADKDPDKPEEDQDSDELLESDSVPVKTKKRIRQLLDKVDAAESRLIPHRISEQKRKDSGVSEDDWAAWDKLGLEVGNNGGKNAAEVLGKLAKNMGYKDHDQKPVVFDTEELLELVTELLDDSSMDERASRKLNKAIGRITPKVEAVSEPPVTQPPPIAPVNTQAPDNTELLNRELGSAIEEGKALYGDEWDKMVPDIDKALAAWPEVPANMVRHVILEAAQNVSERKQLLKKTRIKKGSQGLSPSATTSIKKAPEGKDEMIEALIQDLS